MGSAFISKAIVPPVRSFESMQEVPEGLKATPATLSSKRFYTETKSPAPQNRVNQDLRKPVAAP